MLFVLPFLHTAEQPACCFVAFVWSFKFLATATVSWLHDSVMHKNSDLSQLSGQIAGRAQIINHPAFHGITSRECAEDLLGEVAVAQLFFLLLSFIMKFYLYAAHVWYPMALVIMQTSTNIWVDCLHCSLCLHPDLTKILSKTI